MTREEIIAFQARLDRLRATPLGAAFFKFKQKIQRASIQDTEDSLTDKDRKSTRQAHEEANAAERELLALIEEANVAMPDKRTERSE
jgi:hypothetical protein